MSSGKRLSVNWRDSGVTGGGGWWKESSGLERSVGQLFPPAASLFPHIHLKGFSSAHLVVQILPLQTPHPPKQQLPAKAVSEMGNQRTLAKFIRAMPRSLEPLSFFRSLLRNSIPQLRSS